MLIPRLPGIDEPSIPCVLCVALVFASVDVDVDVCVWGSVQEAQIKALKDELEGKQREFKVYCDRFEERVAHMEGTLRAEWAASEEERCACPPFPPSPPPLCVCV